MGFRRIVRMHCIERLPKQWRLFCERQYFGLYLKDESRAFRLLCDPDKASIDIGANKGDTTLLLCHLSKSVHAFEPVPRAARTIKSRFQGCNVTVYECALGNSSGEAWLEIPKIDGKAIETRSSLVGNLHEKPIFCRPVSDVERLRVQVKKLDDFHLQNIGFIKIDVEGFEVEVLEGARDTILRNRPNLFIEIEQRRHKNKSIFEIFELITSMNYFGYFVLEKQLRPVKEFDATRMQQDQDEGTRRFINNFIFKPNPNHPARF